MKAAAFLNEVDKEIIVPLCGNIHDRIHSVQHYGERFLPELLIVSSGPGEIELNPNWTWKFVLDFELYTIDGTLKTIRFYKEQQH